MVIDLSWVKTNSQKQDNYLCLRCIPDVLMEEVTDPAITEFLGPNNHRYKCPKCGLMYDSTDKVKRVQESINSKIGVWGSNNSSKGAIFEPIENNNKDKLKGTLMFRNMQENQNSLPDPEAGEELHLAGQGYQNIKSEITSSKTGHKYIKEFKPDKSS